MLFRIFIGLNILEFNNSNYQTKIRVYYFNLSVLDIILLDNLNTVIIKLRARINIKSLT